MIDEKAILARWKAMAGDDSPEPWTQYETGWFFQNFRPDGEGLAEAFEGVVGAEEILPRLLEIYRATADGWQSEDHCDAYFVVRNPIPTTAARAEELVRLDLERVAAMAEAVDDADLTTLLGRPLTFEVVEGETPWPPGDNDPESSIYEVIDDFMGSLERRESHAFLLGEAFYTMASDYNLQHYCLWPLCRDASTIEEPFGPYMEGWKHGLGYRFIDESTVRVYVPEGKLRP